MNFFFNVSTKEKVLRVALALAVVALAGWALLLAQTDGGLRFFGPLGRFITPNANVNNNFIFCIDNPSADGVSGEIYSLLGAEVSGMTGPSPASGTSCPAGLYAASAEYMAWDGRSGGTMVHSGVYVYQIRGEGRTYTGTLVVVR